MRFIHALVITLSLAWISLATAKDFDALLKEAVQGESYAQYDLGVIYSQGLGVPQDYNEAVRWYRKAAEQGDSDAQYNLGVMNIQGNGVPEDYITAHMWLNLAAAQGHVSAAEYRSKLTALMTSQQIAEAQAAARKWASTH